MLRSLISYRSGRSYPTAEVLHTLPLRSLISYRWGHSSKSGGNDNNHYQFMAAKQVAKWHRTVSDVHVWKGLSGWNKGMVGGDFVNEFFFFLISCIAGIIVYITMWHFLNFTFRFHSENLFLILQNLSGFRFLHQSLCFSLVVYLLRIDDMVNWQLVWMNPSTFFGNFQFSSPTTSRSKSNTCHFVDIFDFIFVAHPDSGRSEGKESERVFYFSSSKNESVEKQVYCSL